MLGCEGDTTVGGRMRKKLVLLDHNEKRIGIYYMVCILSMSDKGSRNSGISQTADFTLCLGVGFS